MLSLFQSILAFMTRGKIGCGKSDNPVAPAGPTDVTLHVPGMY